MVKLKKLYSKTNLFDEVPFKEGINVIYGKYSNEDGATGALNGIGKSTIIRLVDYLFGSESGKEFFDVSNYKFLEGEDAFLEIEINDKTFLIKKSFSKPNEIYFGKTEDNLEKYSLIEFRKLMGSLAFLETNENLFIENKDFRDLIGFYIKDDLNNSERANPLEFISPAKKFNIYALNLYLMGIQNEAVYKFADLKDKYDNLLKQKGYQIKRLEEETGKTREEITSEILKIESKLNTLKNSINQYKFIDSYNLNEQRLIEISNEINSFLKLYTSLNKKLEEYQGTHKYSIEVNTAKVAAQYKEINQLFGELIKKSLDEVILFRKDLSENRKVFLKEKENELEEEIYKIERKIEKLEEERKEIYKSLDEKEALDSLKNTYASLIESRSVLERMKTLLGNLESLERDLNEKSQHMGTESIRIKAQIESSKDSILNVSTLFFNLVDKILGDGNSEKAIFSIIPSLSKKTDPLSITLDVPKSKSLGKKRFCILIYDLALFAHSIMEGFKFPKFLIHDGIFHAIDLHTISNTLNYVNKIMKSSDFQYIITVNENELGPTHNWLEEFDFDMEECIVKTLTDLPNEMFFKRDLK